jgi:hypothetical protein
MSEPRYWFLAKRYGIGWAVPATWEGWLALIALGFVVAAATTVFPPETDAVPFAIVVTLALGFFVALCVLKGEPAAWRDGDRD